MSASMNGAIRAAHRSSLALTRHGCIGPASSCSTASTQRVRKPREKARITFQHDGDSVNPKWHRDPHVISHWAQVRPPRLTAIPSDGLGASICSGSQTGVSHSLTSPPLPCWNAPSMSHLKASRQCNHASDHASDYGITVEMQGIFSR